MWRQQHLGCRRCLVSASTQPWRATEAVVQPVAVAAWTNVEAETLRLPPRRRKAAIASLSPSTEARELTEVAVAVQLPATMDVEAATLRLLPLPRVSLVSA